MKAILRSAVLAGSVAMSVAVGMSPASAHDNGGAFAFTGEATIGCFGCGEYGPTGNSATFSVTGAWTDGDTESASPHTASFKVIEHPTECPVTGYANGNTSGSVAVSFDWTRVGATAVITTNGDVDGAGTAVFKVTDPVGLPCGGKVTAQFAGAVAGR